MLAAGSVFIPAMASAYTVTLDAGNVGGDRPSVFREVPSPRSSWAEKRQRSDTASTSEKSTFGLKDLDDRTRLRTESMLSDLGARKQGEAILVDLPSDVLFDFDKADIRADARPVLLKMTEILKALPAARLEIVGHTDSKGSDAYNQGLSERRAASVKRWLAENGVSLPMATTGKGETSPVADNQNPDGTDNPAGRQKNRRVQFIIGGV